MIANIIGAMIGRQLDASDGDAGMTGAIVGALVPVVFKRAVPLAILTVGAFALKHALDKRRAPDPLAD